MKTEKILSERINMSDKPESSIKGHVIFRDGNPKKVNIWDLCKKNLIII